MQTPIDGFASINWEEEAKKEATPMTNVGHQFSVTRS